ncbi:MAG: thiamine phosphate synthase, partial [Rhodospirillales bacterium]|nr:thiamine phosphate synthase [Rhodospirillales bacterium]
MALTLADVARRFKPGGLGRRLGPLLLMTDARRLPDPLPAVAALPPGSGVVLRHYEWPEAERLRLGRILAALCRARRLHLLVAADTGLAAALRADGLHLPEYRLRQGAARARLWRRGRGGVLIAAAHSGLALARGRRAGVDAALLSPVFPTASHPGAPCLGPWRFHALRRRVKLPVYGLGGITPETARIVRLLGAAGIATAGDGLAK